MDHKEVFTKLGNERIKRIPAAVKILPQVKDFSWYASDLLSRGSDNWPHLLLFPYCPIPFGEDIGKDVNSKASRCIGFFERSSILSKTERHEKPLFDYFNSYDIEVYYCIMLSLLAFGLMFTVRNRSLSTLFSVLWDFVSVILSDIIVRRIVGSFSRVMIALWLLCSLVLLTGFAAALWNFMIHNDTIDRIDSWDDLHTKPQWKKTKIYSPYYFEMSEFILRDSSPMASDFRKRSIMFDPFKFLVDIKTSGRLMKNILDEGAVISLDSLVLHYSKIRLRDMFKNFGSEGFYYHTSNSGFGMKPYFILFSSRSDSKLVNQFNTLMARVIDMGIYEYEVRKSLRFDEYGLDINTEVDTEVYVFGAITLKQMKGVFIGILICHTFNIFVFLMELLTYHWTEYALLSHKC